MRKFLTILLLFISIGAFAQKPDSVMLSRCVHAFNKALVDKDTVELNRLLRDDVHYYHSNGWLQLKHGIVDDLSSGKLVYESISATLQGIHMMGNIAQAKMTADLDVTMNGKPARLKLKVVQVWVWNNGKWEMFARHSEKI
jgi:hypothetical protein